MSSVPASRYIFGILPWYSFLIVSGVIIAIFLAIREERRIGLKKDTVLDLVLYLLPSGIIGARVYYVLFSWSSFRDNPISALYIWEGGLAIYGAIISGLITILVFCRKRRLSRGTICDLIAPGLALAQAIGRWGNYFNMEAYGAVLTDPGYCFFPFSVYIPADGCWHMATFFYESVWDLLVFIVLLIARRKLLRKKGDVFLLYLLFYAAGRFMIENFRADSLYTTSSVRVSQLLSELICAFILLYLLFFRRDVSSVSSPRGIIGRIFCVLSLCMLLGLILCAFRILPLTSLSLLHQFLILFATALISVIAFFTVYGHSFPEEVLYANHKA